MCEWYMMYDNNVKEKERQRKHDCLQYVQIVHRKSQKNYAFFLSLSLRFLVFVLMGFLGWCVANRPFSAESNSKEHINYFNEVYVI